jgi:hypothetical protein
VFGWVPPGGVWVVREKILQVKRFTMKEMKEESRYLIVAKQPVEVSLASFGFVF